MDKPYTKIIEWLLDCPRAELLSTSSIDKLLSLCRLFDQRAFSQEENAELGFERHNDGSGKIDCFLRGGPELFNLEGVFYPEWHLAILEQANTKASNKESALFPAYYHLEFDDDGDTHRLAGIFQNCWPLRDLNTPSALAAMATYLDHTGLFNKASIEQSQSLAKFIETFGFPCSFGIMDRHQHILKVAAQIESISPALFRQLIDKYFSSSLCQTPSQIDNLINAMGRYLEEGKIWINLDIDVNTDSYLHRFCFELITPGSEIRKNYDTIYECLKDFDLQPHALQGANITTDNLPLGYKRPSATKIGCQEWLYAWFNHAKICIKKNSVDCKTYFGASYGETF